MTDILELEKLLNDASKKLSNVSGKKMFGCHAVWDNDAVFGLVWKTGRIGVKLTDEAQYEKLLAMKGAEPWKAGPKVMSHWVLVPPAFHKDTKALAQWVALAHGFALEAAAKPAKKKAATKAKKPAAKTPVKKKKASK